MPTNGGPPDLLLVRGVAPMTNDAVNLCASLTGTLTAALWASD